MTTTPFPASRRRRLLEQEAERHEAKAIKARERAEQLGDIPDVDPFPDRTVLLLKRGQYTFAVLRIAGGWYTTGPRLGLNRATWAQFVDWLIDGGVTEIYLMTAKGEPATLGDLIPTPPAEDGAVVTLRRMPCPGSYERPGPHTPHPWGNGESEPVFWCTGEPPTSLVG